MECHRATYLANARGAELSERVWELIHDSLRGRRIVEVDRSKLHGAGTGDQELHHVIYSSDAADANNRHRYLSSHLPNHSQGERLNGGSTQAACDTTQYRLSPPPIDRHAD